MSGRFRAALRDLVATHDSSEWGEDPPGATARIEQRSLFGEILDWMFAPLLLLWPMSVGVTFIVARSLADAPFDRAIEERALLIAQQVVVSAEGVRVPATLDPVKLQQSDDQDLLWFQVLAPGGDFIAGEPELPRPALYDFPEVGVPKRRSEVFRGEEIRIAYLYAAVVVDGEEAAPVLVQFAETQNKRNALANEIIKGVIFPQFVILPIALGLVWFGLGKGLKPLRTLQASIRARRPDDLSPIEPRDVPREVKPLVDAFNELLGRLDDSVAVQKRFVADAAHQIKTPLAGLRMQAELALRETDPARLRRSLEQVASASTRAAHLVSQLLAMARAENLRETLDRRPVDAGALVRDVVADWVGVAVRRGTDFGFEESRQAAWVAADPLLLREAIGNLVDNALRYTPAGSHVTVRVSADARTVAVEVEDDGPGIAETDRPFVFERFFRVLGTGADGSGLGLAIVREIVGQLGGTIEVGWTSDRPVPRGARFTIRLPAVAPPAPTAGEASIATTTPALTLPAGRG